MAEESKNSKDDRSINIHPLAILNISDHFTRMSMDNNLQSSGPHILGLLFGVQSGLEVTIFDSSEVTWIVENGEVKFDMPAVCKRKELYEAVYRNYELLGWYSIGVESTDRDIRLHKSLMDLNESPLFLLMDPRPQSGSKQLPIKIFESALHIVNEIPTTMLVETNYKVEATQSEQISMAQVAKAKSGKGISIMDQHIGALQTSLKALQSRVQILIQYLVLLQNQQIEPDYRLLREISNITNQISTLNSEEFQREFESDEHDSMLLTYLAAITKGTDLMNDLAEKASVAFHNPRLTQF